MREYAHREMETKWQAYWEENALHQTNEDKTKPTYYALEQFPYPSGDGLHMGHVRVYSIGDVIARFRKMNGFRVLHPMGADAFGLPAENAAIQRGINPREWTLNNMERIRKEQALLGGSYDWDRYVGTCLPDYYRFTQWLFLLFYERGLAYRKEASVNWCTSCNTVLANEQVEDGKCWRCGTEVIKKELVQWFLRITDYAERLLDGLDTLPKWPDKIRTMQRNWIGKSKGANVTFSLPSVQEEVSVFTTRPDTLYGVTYMVLAPEHPLVPKLIAGNSKEQEILDFIQTMRKSTELERTATDVEKVGFDTGSTAIHPLTGEEIPIWIANYVLFDYGTGAVMGVPAHDERDFAFSQKYDLPVKVVVQPEEEKLSEPLTEAFTGEGQLVASGPFDGMANRKGISAIADHLEQQNKGGSVVHYRLRDWLISRQRYWGTPIPMVYCDDCGPVPVPKDQLPVILPEDVIFDGKSNPLTTSESFVHTTCPACGGKARRETDTMDTFIDSSWYYLRYADAQNEEVPFSKEKADEWLPVNEYIGGIEHAVLHLLYSRFFTKVLYDAGMISVEEPFESLLAQGMVLRDGAKMSKSKGNVVSPLEIIEKYGADTARLFILFAAPPERDLEWSDAGVEGSYRFIKRVWRLVHDNEALFANKSSSDVADLSAAAKELRRLTHHTIQKVTVEIGERNHFNTAVSAVMELVNGISSYPASEDQSVLKEALENVVLLLAPFVPHLAEELWRVMGHTDSVNQASWPSFDPAALVQDEVEIMVQINGKNREKLIVASKASREEIEAIAIANEKIQRLIADKTVRKVIVVPKKLVNVVVG